LGRAAPAISDYGGGKDRVVTSPEPTAILPWTVTWRGPDEDFEIFAVQRQMATNPRTGKTHERVQVKSRDWVNVIAITASDELVLVEQYRHGAASAILETPGGILEEGESPIVAGVRELREETGFGGGEAVDLGWVYPNPAFLTNRCHFVLVRPAVRVGDIQQDEGEDIGVRLVPRVAIWPMIREGAITHALVIAGFALLQQHLGL
jgi:8-oxo-dGTP pyrophosphatase MutT (NUDIX family)